MTQPPLDHLSGDDRAEVAGWDWPAIFSQQAKARARMGLAALPLCRLCRRPLIGGQDGVHRVCKERHEREVASAVLGGTGHQSTNTPLDQGQPLDVAGPVVQDVPSGGTAAVAYTCPRCRLLTTGRFYGPCAQCRAQLRGEG